MKRFEIILIGLVGLTGFATAAFAGQDEWTTNGPDATFRTIKALTIDTTNPAVLYAGTNRGEVFKTIDGTQTWELATEDLPRAPLLEQDFGVRVAVDPNAPNILYAATPDGVFRSDDGGFSWTLRSVGIPPNAFVAEVALNPIDPTILYATVFPDGVFKSVDAGETWSSVSEGLEGEAGISLSIDPSQPDTVYAVTVDRFNRGVFKTINGGESWTRLGNGLLEGSGVAANNLVVSPSNPSAVYVAFAQEIYRSVDFGGSWVSFFSSILLTRIAVDPTDSDVLYVGIRSAIRKLRVGNMTRTALEHGLPFTNVTDLLVDPSAPSRLYAATDNGVYSIDQRPDVCGNFAVDPGEDCDLGSDNGAEGACCTASCTQAAGACDDCQSCTLRFGCQGNCTPTPTSSPSATPSVVADTPTAILPPSPTPTIAAETCIGDCNADFSITVDEVVTMLTIALGELPASACVAGDRDASASITVDEIVAAVQAALSGCVTPTRMPTRTATATPTPISDPVLLGLIEFLDTTCVDFGPVFSAWATGGDGSYSFYCMPGPGHETQGRLTQSSDPLAAGEALDIALAAHDPDRSAAYEFHQLPAVEWERDVDLLPFTDTPEYHGVVWVAGCWLIDVHAFDDTHFRLLPPKTASEALFEILVETSLVGSCPEGAGSPANSESGVSVYNAPSWPLTD